MNGNGTFNGQILVDKLAKLNNSQQSIETLSHWCIFHRKKAKQVVETWARQFHCSPRDQRVSFLYLANDILQNSRRKGLEFVGEFWRVLPDALNDVIENGDEFGRRAAQRLVDIWEERKVFGSRGQTLKEDLLGRTLENQNRNGKSITYKLKQPGGDMLEKLISSYGHVSDEDALFGKLGAAIGFIEKVEKELGGDLNIGNISGSGVVEELQGQHGLLRECVEQLKGAESSRATLMSHLREALHEQEFKIEQVRNQLQAAQMRSNQLDQLLVGFPPPPPPEQELNEAPPPPPPSTFSDAPPPPNFPPDSSSTGIPIDRAQSNPVLYTQQQQQQQQGPLTHAASPHEEPHKTSAAEVAAKLVGSTDSVQMLSYVLSSLASEGVIGQSMKEDNYPSDGNKRPKLNNGSLGTVPCYMPQPQHQPPPPPFPHPDSMHHQPLPPPLPLSLPPIPPPLPSNGAVPHFGQTAGSYSYGTPPTPLPSYQTLVTIPPYPGPPNPYHYQGSDGGLFGQPPPMQAALPPMSRQ